MPGIDDALGALRDLGSAFLLSFFFPIVLFTAINGGLALLLFGIGPSFALATALGLDTVLGLSIMVFVQFSLAWVAAPMIAALRRVIEGELLPAALKRSMVRHAWRAAEAMRGEVDVTVAYHQSLKQLLTTEKAALIVARDAGKLLGAITDSGKITAARATVTAAAQLIPGGGTPKGRRKILERIRAAVAAVKAALELNSVELSEAAVAEASAALDQAQGDLINMIEAAIEDAKLNAEEANGRLHAQFVRDDIRASQLGNLRAVMERYTTKAYGVSFDYMWPRIQAVITADDAVTPGISRSKMQVEFGVMMIAATTLTCMVWLAVSFFYAAPYLFIAVGAAGPLLVSIFHRMALEGQRSLTEAVRAAIDVKRSTLLEQLKVTVATKTSTEECELWRNLERWSLGEDPKVTIR
ncbi:hypothetical protein [Sphingomonas sp.]|uniref:hypothetical protein n=1 Tax=Sphingomonas sp. TaxID=28214 RepID=UPI003D6CE886